MKKLYTTLLFSVTLLSVQAQTTPLKLYWVSHNEDIAAYYTNQNNYLNARNGLVNFVTMVDAKSASYNHGSDHVFPRAVVRWDSGAVMNNTNNKNIMRWMVEDMGVECDPHAHETTYNYADVAYLFTQCGITPTNTMSGFLYNQTQNGHIWTNYQNGVSGDSFPAFTWYPQILWGAATPMHVADPNDFGAWKPQDTANFFVHAPANTLTLCGTGCHIKIESTSTVSGILSQIRATINAIQNGTLPAGHLYQQEIFFGEGSVNQPWFLPMVTEITDSINLWVAAGQAEWRTITEIISDWNTVYAGQPWGVNCDYSAIQIPTGIKDESSIATFTVFPNPAQNVVTISGTNIANAEIQLIDCLGNLCAILPQRKSDDEIILDLSNCASGIYLVKANEVGKVILKE
jgi:hypothetical protein